MTNNKLYILCALPNDKNLQTEKLHSKLPASGAVMFGTTAAGQSALFWPACLYNEL
jgi:hypothetical protein